MAIAALALHAEAQCLPGLLEALRASAGIVEAKAVSDCDIAATMERPSDKLPEALEKIQSLPNVLSLELVYVNYEDDLDDAGHMPCPPQPRTEAKSKKKK